MWYPDVYESVLNRLTPPCACGARQRYAPQRDHPSVSGQPGLNHALGTPTSYQRRSERQAPFWSSAFHPSRPAPTLAPPSRGRPRCLARRACCSVASRAGHPPLSLDHGPRVASPGLVAKKKSLIASERDPWARALFALQQSALDASDLVVVDEIGSNLNLTP